MVSLQTKQAEAIYQKLFVAYCQGRTLTKLSLILDTREQYRIGLLDACNLVNLMQRNHEDILERMGFDSIAR